MLGAGLVGKAIAIDLAKDHNVTSADIQEEALQQVSAHGISTVKDRPLRWPAACQPQRTTTWLVGAVQASWDFETAKKVIEAGRNMVDISFFPEDPFSLVLAKRTM